MNQFDAKDKIELLIFTDCCYSGMWAKVYGYTGIKTKCSGWIVIWSASDYDEPAWDGYFSNLIKEKRPDCNGQQWRILFDLRD